MAQQRSSHPPYAAGAVHPSSTGHTLWLLLLLWQLKALGCCPWQLEALSAAVAGRSYGCQRVLKHGGVTLRRVWQLHRPSSVRQRCGEQGVWGAASLQPVRASHASNRPSAAEAYATDSTHLSLAGPAEPSRRMLPHPQQSPCLSVQLAVFVAACNMSAVCAAHAVLPADCSTGSNAKQQPPTVADRGRTSCNPCS